MTNGCNNSLSPRLFDPSTMYCAGDASDSNHHGPVTCHGDSGGPLLCRPGTWSPWKSHGVVSYGSDDCRQYSVFTRVNQYLLWIQKQVNQSGGDSPIGTEAPATTRAL